MDEESSGRAWGYARVSTADQNPELQVAALEQAGVESHRLVVEHASGARADRPRLAELLEQLQEGDVLTVWRLDRLGRSLSHLVQLVDELHERGVHLRSLTEHLDTTTPAGRLIFHVFGAVAEFERALTAERTRAALRAAKASGKPVGRPSAVTREQWDVIHLLSRHGVAQGRIAATVGLSRPVVGRVVRGEIPSLERKYGTPPTDAGAADSSGAAAIAALYPAEQPHHHEDSIPAGEESAS